MRTTVNHSDDIRTLLSQGVTMPKDIDTRLKANGISVSKALINAVKKKWTEDFTGQKITKIAVTNEIKPAGITWAIRQLAITVGGMDNLKEIVSLMD